MNECNTRTSPADPTAPPPGPAGADAIPELLDAPLLTGTETLWFSVATVLAAAALWAAGA